VTGQREPRRLAKDVRGQPCDAARASGGRCHLDSTQCAADALQRAKRARMSGLSSAPDKTGPPTLKAMVNGSERCADARRHCHQSMVTRRGHYVGTPPVPPCSGVAGASRPVIPPLRFCRPHAGLARRLLNGCAACPRVGNDVAFHCSSAWSCRVFGRVLRHDP